MPKYDWYEVVSGGGIEQGEILEGIDIYTALPDKEGQEENIKSSVETYDVIILTQSCDIPKKNCEHIVVCPMWTLEEAKKEIKHFQTESGLKALRDGNVVGFHIINSYNEPKLERDYRIVNFYRILELPKERVFSIASNQSNRLRLLPPYREHLSQAFARFFMRVGLPVEIPILK